MTSHAASSSGTCPITGKAYPQKDFLPIDQLHPALAERIRQDHPSLAAQSRISRAAVDQYRLLYVEELLRQERGELTELDREVARSLAEGSMVSANIEESYDEKRTLGERLSDGLATFGGSWPFLIFFGLALGVWIIINVARGPEAFDPYPYILLNLLLSCLAAVQALIIMMSQRRQEAKDRLRSLNDYQVNLKAELEIRHLHEKLDHLITRQWERLAEIQELQIELLQERR
ncbi:DUF1003 domain-containing protein [Microvirga tunisiensis]|uniref:DUF1003 domain-containing protein n=1 Tax=Microvirga tunisiensis TaxID=2108360 RepID=A0A5N7MEK8_9HYPH|nr:DUF1003 domain-containing protein [Microvirga tunisiensis]MPR06147.1 DUF1003 domain-containing protein [Microvirga tunisiensis]MPR25227.1 DUF1003 domain-containing protein [Microvirga tunisiensis]